ncbi:MAG: hypothetical protein LBV74_04340 [Tannerella sp.]|jgi:hypothetical protein|nr:hypothetical protein [Tannerella sp.]
MNKIKILVMISLYTLLSSSSCGRDENNDDKLSLAKIAYNGNELRIDGYYCNYYYVDGKSDPRGITPFFLYKNGVIFGYVGSRVDRIDELEESFRNGEYVKTAEKYQWGVFQIEGSKIKYEKWATSEGPYRAFTYEGTILNDTTFVINKSYRAKDAGKKDPSEHHWEFHFKQFSPKPDSTNRFIP